MNILGSSLILTWIRGLFCILTGPLIQLDKLTLELKTKRFWGNIYEK